MKCDADIKFINFSIENQLLTKFVNFKLYDVSVVYESNTVYVKKQLLHREREKKLTELRAAGREPAATALLVYQRYTLKL